MHRSKKILFVSHCVLNQNSVVKPLARAKGAYRDIVSTIMENGIGVHQLPCPEFKQLGLNREPMSKVQYSTTEYRALCHICAVETVEIIKHYKSEGYKIMGIIGIEQSPTCSISGEQGIFMEELFEELKTHGIELSTIDVPTIYQDKKDNNGFIKELEKMIIQY
ncbi:MAG: hypothetical protein GXZ11_00405 [Tissierellia bacterium]|nr:hypothetical protein [Tissierellia bacterium]